MAKQHVGYAIFKHSTALSASLFFNLFLVFCLYYDRKFDISWSWKAAKEAEVVAATPCSGHGRAFLDGPVEEGNHVCECYSCYSGPDCSEFSECPADADGGNPLFLEPFWLENEENSAVMVRGLHRMGYSLELAAGGSSIITDRLQQLILRLHTVVGNANVTGRFVAVGVGSTQLINAAVRALSASNGSQLSNPSRIVATPPFYPMYKSQSEYMNGHEYKWEGDTAVWKNRSNNPSMKFIEFVTSPNNPDGMPMTSVMEGPFTKSIYDHAYYWPHFSAIPSPADEDFMLFTLSKITGHAGSRLGWALVKDEEVYNSLTRYVNTNTLGVSHDTQLRAMRLLEAVLKRNGRGLFEFGYRTMSKRWQRLSKTLAKSRRFSLQKLSPQYCTFFGNVTGPSPAYAWIKCEMEEDVDCDTVFRRADIIGSGGSLFGSENRYLRLSLIKSEDDFDWLIHKLQLLVANEVTSVTNLQDHYNCANV